MLVIAARLSRRSGACIHALRFIEQHDPSAVVIDISMPYAHNWTFVRLIRDSASMRDRPLVLTTTNKRALEELVGPTDTIEIVGKPYEPDEVLEAVRKAIDRRAA